MYFNAIRRFLDRGEPTPIDPIDDASTNTPEEQALEDAIRDSLKGE